MVSEHVTNQSLSPREAWKVVDKKDLFDAKLKVKFRSCLLNNNNGKHVCDKRSKSEILSEANRRQTEEQKKSSSPRRQACFELAFYRGGMGGGGSDSWNGSTKHQGYFT